MRKERNLPPVENQRRQTPPTGESSGVPKHGEGIHTRERKEGQIAATGSGETLVSRQENQDRMAILPSYYTDSYSESDARWLHPKKDKELLRGWDSLAELGIDYLGIIPKPNRPNIPEDDLDAIEEDEQLAHIMSADQWEEEVLFALDVAEDRHMIPEFKRHMQEYRKAIKGIVQLWREEGLL